MTPAPEKYRTAYHHIISRYDGMIFRNRVRGPLGVLTGMLAVGVAAYVYSQAPSMYVGCCAAAMAGSGALLAYYSFQMVLVLPELRRCRAQVQRLLDGTTTEQDRQELLQRASPWKST